jgi:hypothetical protein
MNTYALKYPTNDDLIAVLNERRLAHGEGLKNAPWVATSQVREAVGDAPVCMHIPFSAA